MSSQAVEIWAEDEARLGLQPVIRHQWCMIGSKPRTMHRIQNQWIYVYGFVNPATGETHWLFLPSVSCKLTALALESFALQYGDENEIILLLWDQAGFHQTANMQLPAGIEIFSLPPNPRRCNRQNAFGPVCRKRSPADGFVRSIIWSLC
jgi:hypothetical protein